MNFFLISDSAEQCSNRLQMSWSVRLVQCKNMLESAAATTWSRRTTKEALLHSYGSGAATCGIKTQAHANQWQIVHVSEERPHLCPQITWLLPKRWQSWITWDTRKVIYIYLRDKLLILIKWTMSRQGVEPQVQSANTSSTEPSWTTLATAYLILSKPRK